MKNFRLTLLAATALGVASIGSAVALPLGNTPALGEGAAQNARLVCDPYGRCYNTRRHRAARHYRYQQQYGYRGYDDGYYGRRPTPFGFFPF